MSLQDEIDKKLKEISTDGYPMSIGELINLYKDYELEIHPEFQRVFRWKETQKTKFIESILLGIPIPAIFVSQREDGVWDVVDGLQRLSTIFEFVGILTDECNEMVKPSKLRGTKFLPSLQDKVWENEIDEINSFTKEQRIKFKRQKLDVKIIKESDYNEAKYELFQRINTGGLQLTTQEVRNCLLIMVDQKFYNWLENLKDNKEFQACLPLTEKQYLEQYDMEILIRFIVYRHANLEDITGNEDMGEFITESILNLIETNSLDLEEEKKVFEGTFKILNEMLDENIFRKYDDKNAKFKGAFLLSLFETITPAVSKNLANVRSLIEQDKEKFANLLKEISSKEEFNTFTSGNSRPRPITRFKGLRKFGESLF